jgi:hypothetical protein
MPPGDLGMFIVRVAEFNKVIIFFIFAIFVSIVGCVGVRLDDDDNNDETSHAEYRLYIESDGALICDDKLFIRQDMHLVVQTIGATVGQTNMNNPVYSVGGLSPDEWICILYNGRIEPFKERTLPYLSLESFFTNEMVIKEIYPASNTRIEIVNKKVIESVLDSITPANLAARPDYVEKIYILDFCSDLFPGLTYTLSYLISETGQCFLMDYTADKSWIIGHEILKYLE